MSQPNTEEYFDLARKLTDQLTNQDLDNVVPILSILLAESFVMSGQDKKKCVSYVVGVIDRAFNSLKTEEGKLQ